MTEGSLLCNIQHHHLDQSRAECIRVYFSFGHQAAYLRSYIPSRLRSLFDSEDAIWRVEITCLITSLEEKEEEERREHPSSVNTVTSFISQEQMDSSKPCSSNAASSRFIFIFKLNCIYHAINTLQTFYHNFCVFMLLFSLLTSFPWILIQLIVSKTI